MEWEYHLHHHRSFSIFLYCPFPIHFFFLPYYKCNVTTVFSVEVLYLLYSQPYIIHIYTYLTFSPFFTLLRECTRKDNSNTSLHSFSCLDKKLTLSFSLNSVRSFFTTSKKIMYLNLNNMCITYIRFYVAAVGHTKRLLYLFHSEYT